jgi:hypothetical protein
MTDEERASLKARILSIYTDPLHPHWSKTDDPVVEVQKRAAPIMADLTLLGFAEMQASVDGGGDTKALNERALDALDGLSAVLATIINNWAHTSDDPENTAGLFLQSIANYVGMAMAGDLHVSTIPIDKDRDH